MAWSDAARQAAAEARRRNAKADSKVVNRIMRDYSKMSKLLIPKPNLRSTSDIRRWQKQSTQLANDIAKGYGIKMGKR